MNLSRRLKEYVSACFTGLWIESHEHEEALAEMAQLCSAENWRLATWNIEQGLRAAHSAASTGETAGADPLAAVRALGALAVPDGTSLLVLVNFHRFLNSAEIMQALSQQLLAGKQNRTFVVILAPVVQIPRELEKQFLVLEHELPGREQLQEIAQGVATQSGELPEGTALERVLDAAAGLTRYEAEGAFSLSLVRHGRVQPEVIWELKSQMLKKSGLLSLHRGGESFGALGGLAALKAFCLRAMRRQGHMDPIKRPRGVLLLSPPGCGKSHFAKALGNETGRPTLILDIGALMGSLVGETERNVRHALRIIDAMAPAVVMIDELEKALGGVGGSGQSDSGVSARLFGSLLTWLGDHESDVFVIATCNDISRLPPELTRAERIDGIFFLDLPGGEERRAIWEIYLPLFGIDSQQLRPDDRLWTGAEVRACCRLAALLDLPLVEAARQIVPVAKTASEAVERLRNWANGRCLSADRPGIYSSAEGITGATKAGRRVTRGPSNN